MSSTATLQETTTERWQGSFLAGLSGWTLDAFDFFLVVLSLTAIGKDFHQSVPKMLAASWATLALRPVGAFLFGAISDRFGRRRPLVVNLCFFSVVELATAFTHNYTQFIVVRALFGIVMGGQWGLGATLAMEKVPRPPARHSLRTLPAGLRHRLPLRRRRLLHPLRPLWLASTLLCRQHPCHSVCHLRRHPRHRIRKLEAEPHRKLR